MKKVLNIREAEPGDVEDIYRLIAAFSPSKVLLARSREDITYYLGNFVVGVFGGKICGCCAVRDFGNDLLEVRSLAVHPDFQGKGVGRAMLKAIITGLNLHRERWRLFALTLVPHFFAALGFRQVSKDMFPEKIWSDCAFCPKKEHCDEVAVTLSSEDSGRK